MLPHVRAAVAYIAGRIISGSNSTYVYDYSRARYIPISGNVDEDAVNVFDHEKGAHIGGSPPSLYHYGEGSHISLNVSGHSFTGFDYGTGSHFSGNVSGSAVSLYDYGEGQYFNHAI